MQNICSNYKWHTGSGAPIQFEDIVHRLKDCVSNGGKIYVGSDSFITKSQVNFATAICIHGDRAGGRYFFFREKCPKALYIALIVRMTEEVRRSVDVAEVLSTEYGLQAEKIELHVDVSAHHMKEATSKYSEMLNGYVTGAGFDCKVKPYAWASQTVADRHSK
jgi:uncharacterized protein